MGWEFVDEKPSAKWVFEDDTKISKEEPYYTPEWAARHPNAYGVYGALRELYKTVGRPAISAIPMAVGAMGGLASPVPGGSMVGAGLGYAAGENLNAALDELFELKRQGTSFADRAKQTGKDVLAGAALEGGGQLLTKGTGLIADTFLSPYKKYMTPSALNLANEAETLGLKLSPAEVTGANNLSMLEGLMERTPTSSDAIKAWRVQNQLEPLAALKNEILGGTQGASELAVGSDIKAKVDSFLSRFKGMKQGQLDAMRNRLIEALGSKKPTGELGESAKEILARRSAGATAKRQSIYEEVGAHIPTEKVQTPELSAVSSKMQKEISAIPSQDPTLQSVLSWAKKAERDPKLESLLAEMEAQKYTPELQKRILNQLGYGDDALKAKPVKRDWKTLQNFRVQLNDLIRRSDESIKSGNPALKGQISNEGRIYTELKEALDRDLEAIAESSGPEALDALKTANAFFRDEYAPVWKQKVIRKISYEAPERVVDVLYRPNVSTEIGIAKKAMGEKGFNDTLKKSFTGRLLGQGKTENFDPKFLEQQLKSVGDDTLSAIYTKPEIDLLRMTAKTGRLNIEQKLMDGGFLGGIAKTDPKFVVDAILGTPERFKGSTVIARNISTIKKAIGETDFKNLKRQFTDRLFRENFDTGYVNPAAIAKTINRYGKAMNEFYSPKEIAWLNRIGAVTKRMEQSSKLAANPSGTAPAIITWSMAKLVLFNPIKGTMAAITPEMFAKFYLSPTGRKLFTEGLEVSQTAKEAPGLFSKIAAIADVKTDERRGMDKQ